MIKCFTVIKVNIGKMDQVIRELKKIDRIEQIYTLSGIYDLMIELKINNIEELDDILVNKIDQIEGIINTNTFIVLKEYK